jgi:hypothetical protein
MLACGEHMYFAAEPWRHSAVSSISRQRSRSSCRWSRLLDRHQGFAFFRYLQRRSEFLNADTTSINSQNQRGAHLRPTLLRIFLSPISHPKSFPNQQQAHPVFRRVKSECLVVIRAAHQHSSGLPRSFNASLHHEIVHNFGAVSIRCVQHRLDEVHCRSPASL